MTGRSSLTKGQTSLRTGQTSLRTGQTSLSPLAKGRWWVSTAYRATDNADSVVKLPGYIADFRKGRYAKPSLGTSLSLSGYTLTPGGTGTVTESPAGQVNITGDGTNSSWASVAVPTVVGKLYAFRFTLLAGAVQSVVGTAANTASLAPAETAATVGPFVRYFVATSTTSYVGFRRTSSGAASINTGSVVEVIGMSSAQFSDLFNFTRAGEATYIDANGVLQTAANDVPRFDYTNGKRQLMLEGGSTNVLVNNTSSAGWTISMIAGIMPVLVNSGVINGMEFFDFDFIGTPTSTTGGTNIVFNSPGYTATVDGEIWAGSVYTQLLSGVLPTSNGPSGLRLDYQPTGSGPIQESANETFRRIKTLPPALSGVTGIRLGYRVGYTIGEAVNFRLRFSLPQLEKQPFPTSIIKTSGSAVPRAPDSCRFTEDHRALLALPAASALVQAEGAWGRRFLGGAASSNIVGLSSDYTQSYTGSSVGTLVIRTGLVPPIPAFGVIAGWDGSGKAGSHNGSVVVSNASVMDAAITDAYLGRDNGGANFAYGDYDQLVVYPFRVANTDLPAKAIAYQ